MIAGRWFHTRMWPQRPASRRSRAPHPGHDLAPRRRAHRLPRCSSSARTSSAWARSSSAAPPTRCHWTRSSAARGVLTHSSGNHAQALALAASLAGHACVIVMPQDAPRVKVEAIRGYGARGRRLRQAHHRARGTRRRHRPGARPDVVPPYDHPQVIAGQGTAAKELIEDAGPLDFLLVCVGGGGLISGCATGGGCAVARLPGDRRRAGGRRRRHPFVQDRDAAPRPQPRHHRRRRAHALPRRRHVPAGPALCPRHGDGERRQLLRTPCSLSGSG